MFYKKLERINILDCKFKKLKWGIKEIDLKE